MEEVGVSGFSPSLIQGCTTSAGAGRVTCSPPCVSAVELSQGIVFNYMYPVELSVEANTILFKFSDSSFSFNKYVAKPCALWLVSPAKTMPLLHWCKIFLCPLRKTLIIIYCTCFFSASLVFCIQFSRCVWVQFCHSALVQNNQSNISVPIKGKYFASTIQQEQQQT